jgi:hypothetical protein
MCGRPKRVEGGSAVKRESATGPPDTRTPYEKFVDLARKVVQTPKTEVVKRERAWREKRKP